MKSEKFAFGIITPSLTQLEPIQNFLDNAKKFGHIIDDLIVCCYDFGKPDIINFFQKECKVTMIKRGNSSFLQNSLKNLGLSNDEIQILLGTPNLEKYGKVAYGTSRNYILLAAMFLGIDYLLFFDTDVLPKILYKSKEDKCKFKGIDFIGSHLKFLKEKNVVVTTSDYTGYYIIPKMNFPYLMELLQGIQKEDRFKYISLVDAPVTRNFYLQNVFNTKKTLGGNLAIDLNKFDILPPFFSTTLILDNECFLGRGEDTLFGPIIYHAGGRCVDIDLFIFHNCFGDFPNTPHIHIKKNIDRFFYACMGWIIRNPFFNWLGKEYNEKAEEIDYEKRLVALKIGSKAAAEHFNDKRFLKLPEAFELAYKKLPEDIDHFFRLTETWYKMKTLIQNRTR